MRANGVDEVYITGNASEREKFQKWAETLPKAIGNPLYHWSHLELQRYFDYHGILNGATAEEVWQHCREKMQAVDFSAQGLIINSNVRLLCTTDDPIDSLEWHRQLAEDALFGIPVLPTWRPDMAMNINNSGYFEYIRQLATVCGFEIQSFSDLQRALTKRMDYFATVGCLLSDHALDFVIYRPAPDETVASIFTAALSGAKISDDDTAIFKTAFMRFVAGEYQRRNWAMQLHYGCKRDNNSLKYRELGANSGFDCIRSNASSAELADFLDSLAREKRLPKTVVYSLNPHDDTMIDTVIACFQDGPEAGKLQHGSAWWFNDHLDGMSAQLKSLANSGLLGNFIGMLTDSRSFLSYPRHEYFRRLLCNIIGTWVENGEYPRDIKTLEALIKGISYNNAVRYFGFNLKEIV
jgi:glucuronate isomerase